MLNPFLSGKSKNQFVVLAKRLIKVKMLNLKVIKDDIFRGMDKLSREAAPSKLFRLPS